MTRIEIDLNVRVRGNLTYSGFEHADGPLSEGDAVTVYEPESGLAGPGRVVELDAAAEIVYLEVDWAGLRPELMSVVGARFSLGAGMVVGLGNYSSTGGVVVRENRGVPHSPAAAAEHAVLSRA